MIRGESMRQANRTAAASAGVWWVAAVFLGVTACGGSGGGANGSQAAGGAGALPQVAAFHLRAATASRTIALPGELRSYQEARLFPKVTGFVRDVLVDRGSVVKEGEVLARLDAPEIVEQVSEASARTQAAVAALAEATARYQASNATYGRLQAAAKTAGVVSPDEMERAQSEMRADSARLSSARSQADAVRSAQGAAAQMGQYLALTAPFAGTITERNVSPGALVGPANSATAPPLFRIEDDSRLRLVVAVPEAYTGSMGASTGAVFQVRAFPSDTFHAPLARRAHTLDPRTRTESFEFDFGNAAHRLQSGMYADVLVTIARSTPTFVVPATSVATSVDGPFVIAIVGDTTHWVRVRKGDAIGDRIEVFGNLNSDAVIAVRATEELRAGVRVHAVVAADPATARGP
jgi:membrane fusion protein, multidrug efflux system